MIAIIQARMSSTRLPGKILLTVLGKPLLEYQIERLRRVRKLDDLVLATTHNPCDDQLVDLCRAWGLNCFRGEEDDVLDRYYHAAREYEADFVVRVTSDCPLIDPAVVDRVIEVYCENASDCDYVANTLERTYPRGMDCEVFSMAALERAYEAATGGEREHVTEHMYRRPDEFRLMGVKYSSDQSAHRWTVDTREDFELVRRMLEALCPNHPQFDLEDCLELIAGHPEWAEINQHIKQKK